jgi:hypothetical protein
MRSLRPLLAAVVACALAGSPALSGTPVAVADVPPPPGLGVRLLDAPANRADDPRARVYVVDRVKPGAVFTRHVEVSNGDPTPMDVVVYPAIAQVKDGGFTIAARGVSGPVQQWVSVTPQRVHLEPGARVPVAATFHVPANAPSGEVYGAVVAERPAQRTRQGVAVALRAAVRVYLSVGEGKEPRSDFTVDSLTAIRDKTGRPFVLAQVHNTGGRALDMSGSLRLGKGPGGLSAGPFPATLGTTLGIGQSGPVVVPLDKALPAGPWVATLELRSGLVERKVEGTILFPDKPSSTSLPVRPREVPPYEKQRVVVPVAATLIGVVSLALLIFGLFAFLRRRREEEEEADQ